MRWLDVKQFQYQEFYNALSKILCGEESRFYCKPATRKLICKIMNTDYPYKDDDIEYLLDMVNYELRLVHYDSKKKYFKLGKTLDKIVLDSEFYIDAYIKNNIEYIAG